MLRRSFSLRVFFSRRCRTRASNDEEACGRVTVGMACRKSDFPLVHSRLFDDDALLTLGCLAGCRDDSHTVVDADRCHGCCSVNFGCKWTRGRFGILARLAIDRMVTRRQSYINAGRTIEEITIRIKEVTRRSKERKSSLFRKGSKDLIWRRNGVFSIRYLPTD